MASTPILNMTDMEKNLTIEELETYFSTCDLPKEIQLYEGVRITNVELFVNSHIEVYKHNYRARVYDVFLNRLMRLKEIMDENKS